MIWTSDPNVLARSGSKILVCIFTTCQNYWGKNMLFCCWNHSKNRMSFCCRVLLCPVSSSQIVDFFLEPIISYSPSYPLWFTEMQNQLTTHIPDSPFLTQYFYKYLLYLCTYFFCICMYTYYMAWLSMMVTCA